MILVNLIRQETGVPLEEIMLLRHSNSELDTARKFDVSIEEYTAIQPIGSQLTQSLGVAIGRVK